MSKRALITTAADVPLHLKTWTTVGLDERDLILVVGEPRSPHDAINEFLDQISDPDETPLLYLRPEDQERWLTAETVRHADISQRLNLALLEVLEWGAKTITVVGENIRPLTTDFFERTASVLRGSAPYFLMSTDSGWWNAGALSDPPHTVRGYPLSQRHNTPMMQRVEELDHNLQPSVVVHHVLGDPDVDAVEHITMRTEVNRFRSDTNILLAPGTWCPFSFRSAVTFTRELAPLMFTWPYVGNAGDVWASLAAQRAMQELGRHVVFGFPLVRRDAQSYDALHHLMEELIGMSQTDRLVDALRDDKVSSGPESTALSLLEPIRESLGRTPMAFSYDVARALSLWESDLKQIEKGRKK